MEERIINLTIPVGSTQEEEGICLFNIKETDALISNIGIVTYDDTLEKATKSYFEILKWHIEYLQERSHALDLWKPFQSGNWNHIGGTWITIYGIHVYFRYGRNMKGGRYIPFTKLNISIHNYWRIKKTKS